MAGPGTVLPFFKGETASGLSVIAMVELTSSPLEPMFSWEVGPHHQMAVLRLQRRIDLQPARVLRYLPAIHRATPGQRWTRENSYESVADSELDEAGELVRQWVDTLSAGEMLAMARELAERRVEQTRRRVADLQQALDLAGGDVRESLLLMVALDVDHQSARELAIELAATWSGDADEFWQALGELLE